MFPQADTVMCFQLLSMKNPIPLHVLLLHYLLLLLHYLLQALYPLPMLFSHFHMITFIYLFFVGSMINPTPLSLFMHLNWHLFDTSLDLLKLLD